MNRKIGTKVIIMLVIMSIMYGITSLSSGFATEQALGGMNRMYDNWTQLERLELQVIKKVEDSKFYANMIVWYQNPDVQASLAEGVPAIIEETEALLTQMTAIVEELEDGDLAGTSKEDVQAAITAYTEAVRVVQGQAATVAKLYLAGDVEGSKNTNNGATKNIEDLTAAETALNDIIVTTGDNLIATRRASVDGYAKIADTMDQMAESIDGINIAVDESAQGVVLAAQNTGQLVEVLNNIQLDADDNKDISEELHSEVKRFKNI